VQNVYQAAWLVWKIALGLFIFSVLALVYQGTPAYELTRTITNAGLVSLSSVLIVGLLAVVGWEGWFNAFHQVFFSPGTWLFYRTDTLIRLFPEKFWFDGALTVSGLSLAGGILFAWVGGRIQSWMVRSQVPVVK
jgi:integral membrane protein (TIGR01906 family)